MASETRLKSRPNYGTVTIDTKAERQLRPYVEPPAYKVVAGGHNRHQSRKAIETALGAYRAGRVSQVTSDIKAERQLRPDDEFNKFHDDSPCHK